MRPIREPGWTSAYLFREVGPADKKLLIVSVCLAFLCSGCDSMTVSDFSRVWLKPRRAWMDGASGLRKEASAEVPQTCILSFGQRGKVGFKKTKNA